MYRCKHCDKVIRWTEFGGWVHGRNGEGYIKACDLGNSDNVATPYDKDMEWLKD